MMWVKTSSVAVRPLPMRVNLRRRGDMGRGGVDEGICRHDLANYGRAKTSARLVGTPFRYASPRAGVEPNVARRLHGNRLFHTPLHASLRIAPRKRLCVPRQATGPFSSRLH